MANTRYVASIAVVGLSVGASFAACTNNAPFVPFSSGAASGSVSGSRSGTTSGTSSGSAGSSDGGLVADASDASDAASSGAPETCGPTRYFDDDSGACKCAGNAYPTSKGSSTCTCQSDVPTLCDYDAGQMPQCVDTTSDPYNCGGCGITCPLSTACKGSTCGEAPTQLVAAAPGCMSIRIVYDSGKIYWADMGHGTIKSIETGDGGAVTTIASGLQIAAVQIPNGPLMWPSGPLATALLVRSGTVYWVGASSPVTCPEDGGACFGGAGTTIMSATAGSPPKTLLSMAMDPGPSPVSATDAAYALETPGQNPPILAIALSPDGSTLYFAAGTRFYSIPSSGAGAVTYVGYAEGPEHGEATALAADDTRLYYPANLSGNIEILSLGMMCDPDAAANELCPLRVAESQGALVYDKIEVRGGALYWGNLTSVVEGNISAGLEGALSGADFPESVQASNLTSWALGSDYGYFAEPGADVVCSEDHARACDPVHVPDGGPDDIIYVCEEASPPGQTCVPLGYIEKGLAPPYEAGDFPNATVIARDQNTAMSIAVDGTNVYWTTSRCDINVIADSPQ
jgi:hypothetical protein